MNTVDNTQQMYKSRTCIEKQKNYDGFTRFLSAFESIVTTNFKNLLKI